MSAEQVKKINLKLLRWPFISHYDYQQVAEISKFTECLNIIVDSLDNMLLITQYFTIIVIYDCVITSQKEDWNLWGMWKFK